ncbi:MAG: hypothetical protein QOD42_1415 [Sphingomonadales bacterium]|jgi:hypothetical protein|nr:hypothetical protein [Sphingomonadales bacterium]
MSEARRGPHPGEFDEPEPAPSLADIADGVVRKLVTAIVIAGGLIALAIYFRPSPPRYQAAVGDGRVVRVDTRSGSVIACEGGRCYRILRRGQELDDPPPAKALPAPAARPAQPVPAPPSNAAVPAR